MEKKLAENWRLRFVVARAEREIAALKLKVGGRRDGVKGVICSCLKV